MWCRRRSPGDSATSPTKPFRTRSPTKTSTTTTCFQLPPSRIRFRPSADSRAASSSSALRWATTRRPKPRTWWASGCARTTCSCHRPASGPAFPSARGGTPGSLVSATIRPKTPRPACGRIDLGKAKLSVATAGNCWSGRRRRVEGTVAASLCARRSWRERSGSWRSAPWNGFEILMKRSGVKSFNLPWRLSSQHPPSPHRDRRWWCWAAEWAGSSTGLPRAWPEFPTRWRRNSADSSWPSWIDRKRWKEICEKSSKFRHRALTFEPWCSLSCPSPTASVVGSPPLDWSQSSSSTPDDGSSILNRRHQHAKLGSV